MTVCVYALTGSRSRVSGRGLAGERLHLFPAASVAAVIGRLHEIPPPSPESLRRYDRTLSRLAERVPALLPARFGTRFDDPEELRFVLSSRRVSLQQALAHVRNRVQMTVRILQSSAPHPRVIRPATSGRRSARSHAGGPATARGAGAAYLHERAAEVARERQIPGFDPVRAAISRWVRDERVERRDTMVTVYHLVPRSAADAYRRVVIPAAAAAGLRVVVSGPWPVYAFADTL